MLTGASLLVGVYGAIAAPAYTVDRLYEVSVWDPAAWLAAIALILGVALASAWSAAVLAAQVDPAGLLRSE